MAMLKRKRSFCAQVCDSYSGTSSFSTDAAQIHQPVSVVEEDEMPVRKRRRTDSFEKLPSPHFCDWSGDTTIKQNVFPSGTREYFPPEYFTEGVYHGKPATVWSLGVLLFLLVCGRFPDPRDLQRIDDDVWFEPGIEKWSVC